MLPLYNQFLEKKSFCQHVNSNKEVLTLGLITHNYGMFLIFFFKNLVFYEGESYLVGIG